MSTGTPFNVRTATPEQMIERAEYLEAFPARGRYRDDLLVAEAGALREAAIHRHIDRLEAAQRQECAGRWQEAMRETCE